jgi:hypothetical protein
MRLLDEAPERVRSLKERVADLDDLTDTPRRSRPGKA